MTTTTKKNLTSLGGSHPKGEPYFSKSCFKEWAYSFWTDLVPKCGGCLQPRMTIRLLGSFVLVSGVMVSSAEGSMFVREEQRYRKCLLHFQGLVGDRHMIAPPSKGEASDLYECYPHDINLVRVFAGLGVILLVLLMLATMLMFVAVATDRWRLSLPWAYGCCIVIVQEMILIAGCCTLMGMGDFVLYAIHMILLAYCAAAQFAMLKLVQTGKFDQIEGGEP